MRKFFLLMLLGLIFGSLSASAEEMSIDKMISFADSLYLQKDYYRAITEYERVIFFYPQHPLARTAQVQIAESYFKGEKYDQAINLFKKLADEHQSDDLGPMALFRLGEVYFQKSDYEKAKSVFTQFLDKYPKDGRVDNARLKIGWSSLNEGDWSSAVQEFQTVPAESPLHGQAEGLAEETKHFPDIHKKSPVLAGVLSGVLPGAGQLYIDKPRDSIISFLLNGSFIWASAESFRHHNNVVGGVLLFFEAGWYAGNIYNAVNGAKKYNLRAEDSFFDQLHKQYSLSYYLDEKKRDTNLVLLDLKF
jgi:tetratricopeptide (TPR) repeat protein